MIMTFTLRSHGISHGFLTLIWSHFEMLDYAGIEI
jgi:hypothetical protein